MPRVFHKGNKIIRNGVCLRHLQYCFQKSIDKAYFHPSAKYPHEETLMYKLLDILQEVGLIIRLEPGRSQHKEHLEEKVS